VQTRNIVPFARNHALLIDVLPPKAAIRAARRLVRLLICSAFLLSIAMCLVRSAPAQTTDPTKPTKEYIRLGSRVIAVDNLTRISGQVTSGGAGLTQVTVTLSGARTGSVTTGSDGRFTFDVPPGGNYTVTPSKAGCNFTPPATSYSPLAKDETTANFAAVTVTYTISGYVTLNGASLPGVTLSLTGSETKSASSGSDGSYSFSGLAGGGNYTVTPSKPGYTFNPPSTTYNALSADQISTNFAATIITYGITGMVTEGGAGVTGVSMSLSGSQYLSTSTSYGSYSFSGLSAGGTYTVTPSKTNFTFTPPSISYYNLGGNQVGNFTGNQYPWAAAVSPSWGSTRRQTISFTFRDPDGWSDFEWAYVTIAGSLGDSAACVLYFQPWSDSTHVYLGDNSWNPQWRSFVPGSGSPVTTSLGACTVYPASSSRSLSGTDLTLTMDMEFNPIFSGSKGIWMAEKDLSHSSYTDWVQMGSWSVPSTPTVQIVNNSRPGYDSDYLVGDQWTLTVHGQANQTVSATLTLNGGSPSSSVQGQTDATGTFVMTGQMLDSTVGNWTEVWSVGGVQATPTLYLNVHY
jgi:hypothetical protein